MNQHLQQQLTRYMRLEGKDAQVLRPEDKQIAVDLQIAVSQKLLDMGASELNYRIARRRDGTVQHVAYSPKWGLREWAENSKLWVEMRLATMVDIVQDLLANH